MTSFLFATGIENSYPTIRLPDGTTKRVDEMEKTGHYQHWKKDLPQFVPSGVSAASYCFFLASLHVVLTLAWFSILIAATVPLGGFLRRPLAVKTLDRLTGGIFIAFGVKLAASSP